MQPNPTTPPAPAPVYVSFVGPINATSTEALMFTMAQQANLRVRELHLMLTTDGGTVMHGLSLYAFLRAMPFELVTWNMANCDSIGIPVFLAGERRLVAPHATFLFHGVTTTPVLGQPQGEAALRQSLDFVRGEQKRLTAVYRERTQLSDKVIAELFETPRTVDADTAVSRGIAHAVHIERVPTDATVLVVSAGLPR